jgi:hypothetical protein
LFETVNIASLHISCYPWNNLGRWRCINYGWIRIH